MTIPLSHNLVERTLAPSQPLQWLGRAWPDMTCCGWISLLDVSGCPERGQN